MSTLHNNVSDLQTIPSENTGKVHEQLNKIEKDIKQIESLKQHGFFTKTVKKELEELKTSVEEAHNLIPNVKSST